MDRRFREITGRPYAEAKYACCVECHTNIKTCFDLGRGFLHQCRCEGCKALLCRACDRVHEAMHELAGELIDKRKERRYGKLFGSF